MSQPGFEEFFDLFNMLFMLLAFPNPSTDFGSQFFSCPILQTVSYFHPRATSFDYLVKELLPLLDARCSGISSFFLWRKHERVDVQQLKNMALNPKVSRNLYNQHACCHEGVQPLVILYSLLYTLYCLGLEIFRVQNPSFENLKFITPSHSGECLTGWMMRLILDSVPWVYLEIISGLDSVNYSMEDSSQRIIQWPLLIRMSSQIF